MNMISGLSDIGILINVLVMAAYGLILINGRNTSGIFRERFTRVTISLMALSTVLLYLHYRF